MRGAGLGPHGGGDGASMQARGASWERHVAQLTSRVVTGGAILPIQPEGPASVRKSVMCAPPYTLTLLAA